MSYTDTQRYIRRIRENSGDLVRNCVVLLIIAVVFLWMDDSLNPLDYVFFYYPFAVWTLLVSGGLFLAGGLVGFYLMSNRTSEISARLRMEASGKMVLAFGGLCLVTAVGMSLRPATVHITDEVRAEGGTLGPLEIPHDGMQLGVRINQQIQSGGSTYQRWSFITVELLDENKNYLAGFGGDVWREAGYDEGEHWVASDPEYQATVHIPSAGTYFAQFQTESNVDPSELSSVKVEMYERARWGAPAPFRWVSYGAFFFGALLFIPQWFSRSSMLRRHLNDGGKIEFDGQTWRPTETVESLYSGWRATEWILHPMGPGQKRPRYLEYEYESDSNWKNWLVSRPISLEELGCLNSEGVELRVSQYVAEYDALPNTVVVDGRMYTLEDSGQAKREGGESFRYHTYEHEKGRFVSIEGLPGEELEAVVGGPILLSSIRFVIQREGEELHTAAGR